MTFVTPQSGGEEAASEGVETPAAHAQCARPPDDGVVVEGGLLRIPLAALAGALLFMILGVAGPAPVPSGAPPPALVLPPPPPALRVVPGACPWRSRPLGRPFAGRLVGGVPLPPEGTTFFTWDPVLRRSPNREWRRWGSDRLLATVLAVIERYAASHPGAPRVGIGDLSRPRGGPFGPEYGGLGHVSHQNGVDVDVYYPRRGGRELAPRRPAQIDRRLAQALVDGFVAAGASDVFIGWRTGLGGPRRIVRRLIHHDDHMHVRLRPAPPCRR